MNEVARFSYQLFRGCYYPIIPVEVGKGGRKLRTSAVVDSGASISIFNSRLAGLLGIDVETGEKRIFQGASAKLVGYSHNVRMIVAGKEIECKVAFSEELSTSFNLLGREGIFDKFLITFNEKGRELLIERL